MGFLTRFVSGISGRLHFSRACLHFADLLSLWIGKFNSNQFRHYGS